MSKKTKNKDNADKQPKSFSVRGLIIGILIGTVVAVVVGSGIFAALYYFVYLRELDAAGSHIFKLSDVMTATVTALGTLVVGGGLAYIQLRKHIIEERRNDREREQAEQSLVTQKERTEWEDKQAQQDFDIRAGEQLTKAIEHLGNDDLHIRVGAIYEMKRLAEDSNRDRENVVLILLKFAESGLFELEPATDEEYFSILARKRLPSDTQAALELLAKLDGVYGKDGYSLWLQGLNARGYDLSSLSFKGANLSRADLEDIRAFETNFENAAIFNTNFHNASLIDANFAGTNAYSADFRDSYISGTQFKSADIDSHQLAVCHWPEDDPPKLPDDITFGGIEKARKTIKKGD